VLKEFMSIYQRIGAIWLLITLFWGATCDAALKTSCLRLLQSLSSAPKSSMSLFEGIIALRPTQFDYGLPRVAYIKKKLQGMDFDEVQEYLDKHSIPVVKGPGSELFMVDRHNTLRGLAESQDILMEKFGSSANDLRLKVVIIEDKSSLGEEEFFRQMLDESLLYPYRKDKLMNISDIPKQVLDLKKDYFRGLAWLFKKAGIIEANDIPFSDFMWASKLREISLAEDTIWSKPEVQGHLENFFENYHKFKELPGFKESAPDLQEAMMIIKKYLP
jgi:hypothetical protein